MKQSSDPQLWPTVRRKCNIFLHPSDVGAPAGVELCRCAPSGSHAYLEVKIWLCASDLSGAESSAYAQRSKRPLQVSRLKVTLNLARVQALLVSGDARDVKGDARAYLAAEQGFLTDRHLFPGDHLKFEPACTCPPPSKCF